jgi:uncharacterized membrane protein YdjX (TVP38/TMEM64 family)
MMGNVEWLQEFRLIDNYMFIAPIGFIIIHLIRPFFFFPVLLLCVTGGILFGTVAGTVYSVIGLTLSSIIFYGIMQIVPKLTSKCKKVEEKMFGKHKELTLTQICLLRLLPFMHFHLLSYCLYEMSKESFSSYLKTTFITVTPLSFFYTAFGQSIKDVSIYIMIPVCLVMLLLIYITRKKQIIIKWNIFFSS